MTQLFKGLLLVMKEKPMSNKTLELCWNYLDFLGHLQVGPKIKDFPDQQLKHLRLPDGLDQIGNFGIETEFS